MVRIKKRWNQDVGPRTLAQMANAIGATIWKLAANVVLNLENENFETATQDQRIDIMEEVVCYMVHISDRWIYPRADQPQRAEFVSSLVKDMGRMLEDSRVDVQGPGEYQAAFFDKVNQRSGDYSSYAFSEHEGCSFAMRCRLGDRVQASMGDRDNRWIPDYIIGREAPEIETALRRSLTGLVVIES
jgi:stalled ribosome rescue protein Dom34